MTGAIDTLEYVSDALRGYGVEAPRKEAELILARCIGVDRVALYRDNPILSETQREEIDAVLERRQKREPIQYIIGDVDFCGLTITVGSGVLIPRPETELLVEEVVKTVVSRQFKASGRDLQDSRLLTAGRGLKILDLCTGSGCIALSLANHFPLSTVVGVDKSREALQYARSNAAANRIANATFIRGDLFEPVEAASFDVIVSNPPYIRTSEIKKLDPEIRSWEPIEALDGGDDGLLFYRTIIPTSREHLAAGGFLFMELGVGESTDAVKIATDSGFRRVTVGKDYTGIDRFLQAAA